jgi:glycosyltransferase involved in cell wall biosynthesis
MRRPSLCIIFEAIGPYSAIAKIAATDVRIALDAGYDVTVVAKLLDESLRDKVKWVKLYVPPRGFALQWLTARHMIRRALGDRTFDIIHAHQPQVADLADVFMCHFLTRVAYERKCLEERPGLRPKIIRAQQQVVLYAEDYCYRRWNPQTHMLFDSELTRQEFARLYGMPPSEQVLVYPLSRFDPATDEERRRARREVIGREVAGPVVGYLGGLNERKGYQRAIAGVEKSPDLFLLMGGQHTEGFDVPSLAGRFKSVGLVKDTARFYAACDVLVVPSLFEPLGLVAFEAAARGTPVLMTREVGALPHMTEYGAGIEWPDGAPLGPLVHQVLTHRTDFLSGARRMAEELSEENYGERLMAAYDQVLRRRRDKAERPAA